MLKITSLLFAGLYENRWCPPFSGARYFGDSIKIADSDHFTIARVPNADALQHRLLVKFIRDLGPVAASRESSDTNHPRAGDVGSETIPASEANTPSQIDLDCVPKFRDAIMDPSEINDLIAAAETRFHVSIERHQRGRQDISGGRHDPRGRSAARRAKGSCGFSSAATKHWIELIGSIEGFEVAFTWSQAARARALITWLARDQILLVLDDAHLADQDCRAALIDAASAPNGACRLLTVSQLLITTEKSGRDVRRFTPAGFDRDKICRVMEMRGSAGTFHAPTRTSHCCQPMACHSRCVSSPLS